MRQGFEATNRSDDKGRPAGGFVNGIGMAINWQDGPLGRGEDRKESNGAFVEDVIAAAKQRIEFYQESEFACKENAMALSYLERALSILDDRTKEREARSVEGTHRV